MSLGERIKAVAEYGRDKSYEGQDDSVWLEDEVRSIVNEALNMAQAKCSELAASYDQKCNSEARAGSHVMSRVFDHKSGAASRCVSLIEALKVKPLQELP